MLEKADLQTGLPADVLKSIEDMAILFDTVEPGPSPPGTDFECRISTVGAALKADYERLAPHLDLLLGEDITEYGSRTAALFASWLAEGGCPSLSALAAHAVHYFDLDEDDAVTRGLFMAALIGETPNGLQYHGNDHYRKVLFHAIRMAATHNNLFEGTDMALEPEQVAVLLIAACIHDLGHQGGDNLRGGVYTPGAMEQISFDLARPYLEATGMDSTALGEVETLVFCTDITFFAGDNSPCLRMKKIYKHYFWEDNSEDISIMTMGKLRRFDENPSLVRAAMILHEADVGTSAGLTYEQTIIETINIMEERGLKTAGPRTVLAFLREQLGETFFTEAGKQLFGPGMSRIIARAEQDIKGERQSFYV